MWKNESAHNFFFNVPCNLYTITALPHAQSHCTSNQATDNTPCSCPIMTSSLALQNQHHNSNLGLRSREMTAFLLVTHCFKQMPQRTHGCGCSCAQALHNFNALALHQHGSPLLKI